MTNIKNLAIEILNKDFETRNKLMEWLDLYEKYLLDVEIENNLILNQLH